MLPSAEEGGEGVGLMQRMMQAIAYHGRYSIQTHYNTAALRTGALPMDWRLSTSGFVQQHTVYWIFLTMMDDDDDNCSSAASAPQYSTI